MSTILSERPEVEYPDSDGEPMAENTVQYRWIVTIKDGLDDLFRDEPNVFVAADLFWYPVEGEPGIRVAPDTLVVFGRPKRDRGSYKQWEEGGIPPQVVFEITSPSNRGLDLLRKYHFYERYGVEEYYRYDPDTNELNGFLRGRRGLIEIPQMNGWTSPRLDVRFERTDTTLRIVRPDGRPLLTYDEQARRADEAEHRAEAEHQRAEAAERVAQAERQRAEALAARLRELGIEP